MGQKVQAPSVRAASSLGFFKPLGISGGAVQTPGKKGARHFLNTARGKERPAPTRSSEEEEDSEEDGVVTQVDLWGAEDSDADVIDDYGADSNSEDGEEEEGEELLPIEKAAKKQKAREAVAGGHWCEEETHEEEEMEKVLPESVPKKNKEMNGGLQINVDEEPFVLPTVGEMEQDAQTPDLQQVHKRIQDIVEVLQDFGSQREEGRSRSEYLHRLQKDLATYYSYGDFLLGKLMDLFPLSEVVHLSISHPFCFSHHLSPHELCKEGRQLCCSLLFWLSSLVSLTCPLPSCFP